MRLVRIVLLLDVAAAASVGAVILLGAGIPLASGGALRPAGVVVLAALASVAIVAVGCALLVRSVARPVERMLATAARMPGSDPGWPALSPGGEPGPVSLARAAIAFERVTAALAEERVRLTGKVRELEQVNRALAEARESWMRSERLAVVGRLASGVAHEVGNPLGAITGFAELARGKLAAGALGQAADLLDRIGNEALRIDRIVRDLLDFARPSQSPCVPLALTAPLEAALRLARVQPRFQDVGVAVEVPPGLPAVLADDGRLAQVLLNLFLNAGDAMDGRGELSVRARADGDWVEIEVADRGPGIAPDVLPRVFEPFFTTKAPGAGTGLGLAVCQRLMESMDGTIEAGNGLEGGAVFRLQLRAAAQP